MEGSLQALPFLSVNPPCRILFAKIQLISELSQIFTKTFSYPPFSSVEKKQGLPILTSSPCLFRVHPLKAVSPLNRQNRGYTYKHGAYHLFFLRFSHHRMAFQLPSCCGTCPSSGWLFLKHAVRFFSATQWRTFYRDCSARSAVRIVVMDAENLFSGSHAGKHVHRVQPLDQSFFILFFTWILEFDF